MTYKNLNITVLIDLILLTILFLLFASFYASFDPSEMRIYGVFPWDSGIYRDLAGKFASGYSGQLEAMYPFGTRILFPFMYGSITKITGISFVDAAYYLNLVSSFLVTIFSFYFWRHYGVSRILTWIGIFFLMFSWLGPLRYSGYYPGGSFAFEILLVCSLFIVLSATSAKASPFLIFLAALLIFAMACGKEVVTYILFLVLLTKYFIFNYKGGVNFQFTAKSHFFQTALNSLKSRSYSSLIVYFLAAASGYVFSHVLVHNAGGKYSVIKTIFNFAWFHLHPGEFLYPIFYALGPIALCVLLVFSFKKTRRAFFQEIESHFPNSDLIIMFAAAGLIFCMVGGTDSDRFLLWFFPFYALLCFKALTVLVKFKHRRMNFSLVSIFIIGLMWSRFYVPAIPHLIFPGDNYNAYAGIRTNYDPALYYGPSFMQDYRKPLQDISLNEAYTEIAVDNPSKMPKELPKISATLKKEDNTGNQFKGSYKYDVNIIPFPFGYPHNQYEFLTAHPSHGDHSVRITLLIQWLLAYLILILVNRKWLKYSVG
jgi:hypothetical protein